MSTEAKITQIKELLNQLYCFDEKQTKSLMGKLSAMQEEGLDKLISTLEEGVEEQEKMIENWIRREPAFGKRLAAFVDNTANTLSHEYEKTEKESAENILTEIK